MSKSFRKTRAQKIRAAVRRQSASQQIVKNEIINQDLNAMVTTIESPVMQKSVQDLYVYPVKLIKGDIVRSLIVSGALFICLLIITWIRK